MEQHLRGGEQQLIENDDLKQSNTNSEKETETALLTKTSTTVNTSQPSEPLTTPLQDDDDESNPTITPYQAKRLIRNRIQAIIEGDSQFAALLAVANVKVARILSSVSASLSENDAHQVFEFKFLEDHRQSIPTTVVEGNVVPTRWYDARQSWTSPLYIRQDWVGHLDKANSFVDRRDKLVLYVKGAQGCGKSCFLWMWARMNSNHMRKRVLLIQYREMVQKSVFVLEDGTVQQLTPSNQLQWLRLPELIDDLLNRQNPFDICICEGICSNDSVCDHLLEVLYPHVVTADHPNGKIKKLVMEISLEFYMPLGDETRGDASPVDELSFDSWTLGDYEKAVVSELAADEHMKKQLLADWATLTDMTEGNAVVAEDKAQAKCSSVQECQRAKNLSDSEKILQVVGDKFYYAGGCARFMFDYKVDDLMGAFDWCSHSDLMQTFKSRRVPLSRLILHRQWLDDREIVAATITSAAAYTQNSMLKHWAFQLNQFNIICSAREANSGCSWPNRAIQNSALIFCPNNKATFHEATNELSLCQTNVVSGMVIWCPTHWSQGGFDVALYFDDTLVTLQFTVASSHCTHLQCLKYLRRALLDKGAAVKRMVHVVVAETLQGFSLDVVVTPDVPRLSDAAFAVEVATSGTLEEVVTTSEQTSAVGVEGGVTYIMYDRK